MNCRVQPWPIDVNVIVPDPDDFHPALATVMTMLPELTLTAANVLICPLTPLANVAVELAAVVK
jgi:hypothetical protein